MLITAPFKYSTFIGRMMTAPSSLRCVILLLEDFTYGAAAALQRSFVSTIILISRSSKSLGVSFL